MRGESQVGGGRFERYGHPVARAAVDAGAHYIDSTGEVGFVRALHDRCHDRARETGSVLLPAFGYDYVPGVLTGTLAARQGGDAVRAIDIGYGAALAQGLTRHPCDARARPPRTRSLEPDPNLTVHPKPHLLRRLDSSPPENV
ncbi:hypothetical protein [Streptomyces sp. NPDC058755]|uniref:hypothetical protein n=1 Tax=Streptomyces sp. NPDC058755 TaxID=3346624 RepID=UPI0036AFB2D3